MKIGSCLMIGLKSEILSKEEQNFLIQEEIAGVILFKRNIKSFKQTHELIRELKSLPLKEGKPPLLVAVDMEGGIVDRLSHLKDSLPWPSPKELSAKSPSEIKKIAKALGEYLQCLGFDINFAPVVDLPLVQSELLNSRTFGKTSKEIIEKGGAFSEGLMEGGVISCLKHFPGHGGVSEDSHHELPQDSRSLKELEEDLDIFGTLVKEQSLCVMTAHILFPQIDKVPATFSSLFIEKELIQKRGFSGLVVSDDIDMLALKSFSPSERVFYALKAHCDLILSCQKEETYREALENFSDVFQKNLEESGRLQKACEKILKIREQRLQYPLKSWEDFSEKEIDSKYKDLF